MRRQELIAIVAGLTWVAAGLGQTPRLPDFWKSRLADVDAAVKQVKKGSLRVLTRSAGKRAIYLVSYGAKPDLKSRANYNSAAGGLDPASYARKDGTQAPVVFLLGPVPFDSISLKQQREMQMLLENSS